MKEALVSQLREVSRNGSSKYQLLSLLSPFRPQFNTVKSDASTPGHLLFNSEVIIPRCTIYPSGDSFHSTEPRSRRSSAEELACSVALKSLRKVEHNRKRFAFQKKLPTPTLLISSTNGKGTQSLLRMVMYVQYIMPIIAVVFCYTTSLPDWLNATEQKERFGFVREHPFVWDDLEAILHQPDVQGTTSISSLFFSGRDFWGQLPTSNNYLGAWRPVTIAFFRLQFYFTGLLYIANQIIDLNETNVRCTKKYMSKMLAYFVSCASGMAYAVDPIHTEILHYACGRAQLLCTLLFLIALSNVLQYHGKRMLHEKSLHNNEKVKFFFIQVGLSFLCGLTCAEGAVVGIIIAAADFLLSTRRLTQTSEKHDVLLRTIPLLSLSFTLIWIHWRLILNSVAGHTSLSLWEKIEIGFESNTRLIALVSITIFASLIHTSLHIHWILSRFSIGLASCTFVTQFFSATAPLEAGFPIIPRLSCLVTPVRYLFISECMRNVIVLAQNYTTSSRLHVVKKSKRVSNISLNRFMSCIFTSMISIFTSKTLLCIVVFAHILQMGRMTVTETSSWKNSSMRNTTRNKSIKFSSNNVRLLYRQSILFLDASYENNYTKNITTEKGKESMANLLQSAEFGLLKVLRIEPQNAKALLGLGLVYERLELLNINLKSPVKMGKKYFILGSFRLAVAAPNGNVGWMLATLGKKLAYGGFHMQNEAAMHLSAAIHTPRLPHQNRSEWYHTLAVVELRRGRLEKAKKVLAQAISEMNTFQTDNTIQDVNDGNVYALLGLLLSSQGQFLPGVGLIRKCTALQNNICNNVLNIVYKEWSNASSVEEGEIVKERAMNQLIQFVGWGKYTNDLFNMQNINTETIFDEDSVSQAALWDSFDCSMNLNLLDNETRQVKTRREYLILELQKKLREACSIVHTTEPIWLDQRLTIKFNVDEIPQEVMIGRKDDSLIAAMFICRVHMSDVEHELCMKSILPEIINVQNQEKFQHIEKNKQGNDIVLGAICRLLLEQAEHIDKCRKSLQLYQNGTNIYDWLKPNSLKTLLFKKIKVQYKIESYDKVFGINILLTVDNVVHKAHNRCLVHEISNMKCEKFIQNIQNQWQIQFRRIIDAKKETQVFNILGNLVQ